MSQRWRPVGNTVFNLTGPKFKPQTSHSTDERATAPLDQLNGCFRFNSSILTYSRDLFFVPDINVPSSRIHSTKPRGTPPVIWQVMRIESPLFTTTGFWLNIAIWGGAACKMNNYNLKCAEISQL